MIRIENVSKSFTVAHKKPLLKNLFNVMRGPKTLPLYPPAITKIDALSNVSLELRDGEITGLLGLNGAGKSTLMRLLYGLLPPSGGDVWVDDISVTVAPNAARQKMGVLPDDAGLYKRLSARENMRYFGELQGLKGEELETNINYLIDRLGMANIAERRAEGFSLGERMKTALARAIVHQPQHILLDEPTNGLDVITTRAVRRLLLELKDQGRCLLFSSHLMHEVSSLCDRVVVIARGVIVADGSVDAIKHIGKGETLEDAFINLVEPHNN